MNTIDAPDTSILKVWEHPADYGGHSPDGDYVLASQCRDSDSLGRSNYTQIFADLNALQETLAPADGWTDDDGEHPQPVSDFRASHWAVGWVEHIIVRADAPAAILAECVKIAEGLANYPVYDEEHWSELEHNEACECWAQMSVAERVGIIKESKTEASVFAARRDEFPQGDDGSLADWLR